MAIIRWNPWNLSSLLEDDFDFPTVPGVSRMLGQGMNIYETDDSLIAEVALPGITEDKIEVSVDQRVVRVTATSEHTQEDKDKRKYFMSSMAQSYNYSFRLPDGVVDSDEPKAELHNGVLTLNFPKAQPVAPKKIKVLAKSN